VIPATSQTNQASAAGPVVSPAILRVQSLAIHQGTRQPSTAGNADRRRTRQRVTARNAWPAACRAPVATASVRVAFRAFCSKTSTGTIEFRPLASMAGRSQPTMSSPAAVWSPYFACLVNPSPWSATASMPKTLAWTIVRCVRVGVLMIDELGFMKRDRCGAELSRLTLTTVAAAVTDGSPDLRTKATLTPEPKSGP